uniref:C3H1-type domain-containing protein n=1 Tax=Tetraodon nigroviridis TaxID=99883 RepID=H3BYS7_TETNG
EYGGDTCQFFLKGTCRFGQRCRLSHRCVRFTLSVKNESLNQDDKEEQMKSNKSEKTKHEATVSNPDGNKKPRMRTADDVISRILWDPVVDSSEFVVGYVDRFLGVLERPFDDFTWDTNPCDCDYSAELALPRHRIQYFTYRGHRVWDRHTRTDRVFGSTGQTLAPPFGRVEEVNGITTDQQPEPDAAEEGEEENAAEECAQTEKTHVEEEEPRMKNYDILSSAQSAGIWSKSRCLEGEEAQGTSPAEDGIQPEPKTLSAQGASTLEDTDEEPLEPGKDDLSDPGASHAGEILFPLEQMEKRGGRPPKKRPTHFICFRANTPAILSGFQQLQEELTTLLPASAPNWSSSSSLHVTLCLLVLPGPAEVAAAGEMLRRFAQLDRNPPVVLTFPLRLKHFNGRVLYLSPHPQLHLQQLNGGLQEAFRREGWLHRHSNNPRYHLTLAKSPGEEEDRVFERVGDLKVGKGLNFGRLPVNTLHLCSMGLSGVDGFYQTLCTVTLRLPNL